MAKMHYVKIVKTKGERERESKERAEVYFKMNLEPMPRAAIEAGERDWRRWWREEKPSERYQREKLRREKTEKEKEREKKRKEWEVEDRRKVFNFLQKQKAKKAEAESGKAMAEELATYRRRRTEERRRALFKEMVLEWYR